MNDSKEPLVTCVDRLSRETHWIQVYRAHWSRWHPKLREGGLISYCLPHPLNTLWSIAYKVELPYRFAVNILVFRQVQNWTQTILNPFPISFVDTQTIVTAFSLLIRFLHMHLTSSCKHTPMSSSCQTRELEVGIRVKLTSLILTF